MTDPTPTLEQALVHAYETRWKHGRDGGKCDYSQAKKAVSDILTAHLGPDDTASRSRIPVDDIGDRDVQQATAMWYAQGLAPATINKRLNCLSVLGVNVEGCRQKVKPALKWWLTPEEEARAVAYLTVYGSDDEKVLADLIQWTTKTGLRIEESLRLTWTDLTMGSVEVSMSVPGLKTATSQATLPVSLAAVRVLERREKAGSSIEVFPISYETLRKRWDLLRDAMQWMGNGVTLKALRRSAARYLHVDCSMPLDLVRCYLRHNDVETTLGYLRLVGGYSAEEMRRWLK